MRLIKNIFTFLAISLTFLSCLPARYAWYNFSGITDYKIFPSRSLPANKSPFHFIETDSSIKKEAFKIKSFPLDSLLNNTPTVAFLIIRNDSIMYENYFKNYNKSSIVASFSMAKSYISALVGIAIHEGFITNVNDSITKYIPELSNKKGFNKITIRHLLQMTSGIKSSESYYSPFGLAARMYYGRHLKNIITHLKTDYEPGTKFAYRSMNTQMLGLILERATKKNITQYLNEKIWQPLGMEYDASWSIDKKNNGLEKAFCCINARARDYAKFGRLYLNKGNWNGKQLIPEDWIKESTKIDTEAGSVWYYQYQWWITNKKQQNFAASGLHGQYIYVNPSKRVIIVRLGKETGKNVNWHKELEKIAAGL